MKKTAVITGAGRGIGFAIAVQLAKEGFQLVLIAASPAEKHKERLDILKKVQADFYYMQADVSREKDRIRCLEMTEESFDRLIAVNTKSVMFLSQLVAKQMLNQKAKEDVRGIIINISSMSATVSSVNRGEYCVSKAGVSMLTKLYADRLAGERIYVYEIRPGIIQTDMTDAVHEKYTRLFKDGGCPIARWGRPEDVAEAVSILCTGRLKYTTGQVIDVDGGFQLQRL